MSLIRMKTSLYHLQLNVSDASISFPFYKKLFSYFEFRIIDESEKHLGVSNDDIDFWIMETEKGFGPNSFHRKNTGLNHLALRVEQKEDVDSFYKDFLQKENIITLYSTPKLFSEYTEGYYALFFEDPDRIKIEVAYIPK